MQTCYFNWSVIYDTITTNTMKRKCTIYINTCVPVLLNYNVRRTCNRRFRPVCPWTWRGKGKKTSLQSKFHGSAILELLRHRFGTRAEPWMWTLFMHFVDIFIASWKTDRLQLKIRVIDIRTELGWSITQCQERILIWRRREIELRSHILTEVAEKHLCKADRLLFTNNHV